MDQKPIVFVTSWGPGGYEQYAKRFLESFKAYFPKNVLLKAYFHDCELPLDAPYDPRIQYFDQKDNTRLQQFKQQYDTPLAKGIRDNGEYDFRFDAIKFCNKVYAIDRAYRSEIQLQTKPWLVWIDADTVATMPIPEDFFPSLIKDRAITTLMRMNQKFAETSFMAFDLADDRAVGLLEEVFAIYGSGQLFDEEQWHDGWVYSKLFRKLPYDAVRDLAPKSTDLDAFHKSPLVAFMQHFKGDKKLDATKTPFRVNPIHVVPPEEVVDNIRHNSALTPHRIQQYLPHERHGWLVGSGPTAPQFRDDLVAAHKRGEMIMCVKHSLPMLREWGIEPTYCVVLDPRSVDEVSTHGAKRRDLYGGRAGSTVYLVASMTAKSTVEHLVELGADIVLWHAYTKGTHDARVVPPDEIFITGGTCAVMRGVGLAYMLGFRRLSVVGVDASQPERPSDEQMAMRVNNNPKWFTVSASITEPKPGDRRWWTTGELVALAQDVDELAKRSDLDMNVRWLGESLAQFMWNAVGRKELPEYGA